MSHVARVEGVIRDLDALGQAAETFGGELQRDQRRFRFYGGQTEACLHKLRLKGAGESEHEVGLRQLKADDPEAGFSLNYDVSYAGNVNRAFGPNLMHLRNEYQALVAEKALRKKGCRVQRSAESTPQRIQLVARA